MAFMCILIVWNGCLIVYVLVYFLWMFIELLLNGFEKVFVFLCVICAFWWWCSDF